MEKIDIKVNKDIENTNVNEIKYYYHKIDDLNSKVNKFCHISLLGFIPVLIIIPLLLWTFLYYPDLRDQNALLKTYCNITKVYPLEEQNTDGYSSWIDVSVYLNCFYIVNNKMEFANKLVSYLGIGKISDYLDQIKKIEKYNPTKILIPIFYESYDPSINHWIDFSEKLGLDFSICVIMTGFLSLLLIYIIGYPCMLKIKVIVYRYKIYKNSKN
jgi:hypothetical protein